MNVKPTSDGIANLILPALVRAWNNQSLSSPSQCEGLRRESVKTATVIRKALAAEIDGYADVRQRQASQETDLETGRFLDGEERALRDLAAILRGDKPEWE